MNASDIRNWTNNNATLVTVVAILLLLGALIFIVLQSRGTARPQKADIFFYDLSAKSADPLDRLFASTNDQLPPILSPTDKAMGSTTPTGVRAGVYACGDCSDKSRYFIAFLETYTREGLQAFKESNIQMIEQGHLTSSPGNEQNWVIFNSPEGQNLRRSPLSRCPDNEPAVGCFPADAR